MNDIQINLIRHRPLIEIRLPRLSKGWVSRLTRELGIAFSGTALVCAVSGGAALALDRDVSTGLQLGALGSVGAAVNRRLQEQG